jgi:hypothetical protein
MEPKLRTFVPVIVRGEENEGVRFWGFGKTVYQELLGYIADPDYGDITDVNGGRDITIEYTSAEDAGTSYPVTTIRIKPNQTPLSEDSAAQTNFMENQTNITDIYSELSYEELKSVLEGWLNPTAEDGEESVSQETLSTSTTKASENTAPTPSSQPTVEEKKKMDDVASAFDDLFNG